MRTIFAAAALAAIAVASPAFAQKDFPNRTVTLTVGFAPGGGTDTAARIVAKKITEDLGVTVVVENRAGAGGEIAAQQIAGAAPDGYTIHLSSIGPLAVAPAMSPKLGYDPKRDIAPITMGVIFPNVFVVPAASPIKTLPDLVTAAKKDPGKITYGSSGVGGAAHLAGELFKKDAKIDMVHVPYKGGGPAMVDLVAGRVNMYPAVPSTALPQIKAGKIRAIATTGLKRTAMLPDVPTVAEQGYPGFEAVNWYAFVAPAKTPRQILDFWNKELVKVLNDPEVKKQLDAQGLEPAPGTREELAQYIDRESAKWGKVVRDAHITSE